LTDFNGLTIRLAEWKAVGLAMEHHWLIGHGTGGGKPALLEAYEQLGFKVGLEYGYNAHNQLLETLLGHGLVGLCLLLVVLVLAFYDAWKQRNWLAMWFLLFFFLSMQTESMLVRHRGALFFALFVTLTMLAGRFSKSSVIKQ
jgi:O-antigen ligase